MFLKIFIFISLIQTGFSNSSIFHSLYREEDRFSIQESDRYSGWMIDWVNYDPKLPFTKEVGIRCGYFKENPDIEFKGNILYLQGLGDSMLNHQPLFEILARSGYRVISFDYQGQGGSTGTMNHTRVRDTYFPELNIHTLAEIVFEKFARIDDEQATFRTVIGWSTGGLAAYEMAERKWAHRVILIAPGIAPRAIVGKAFTITKDSLTSASYPKGKDPHIDPIRPKSPLLVPLFATNLLAAAAHARKAEVSEDIPGIVFFGGDDRYIFSSKTRRAIKRRASHFQIVFYPNARHEIDNEVDTIRKDFQSRVMEFLAKTGGGHEKD